MNDDNFSTNTPVAGLPTQKTFNIDYHSEQENRQYQGIFVIRRPSILDQARIEAEKSKILGGRYHDPANPGVGIPEFANNIAEAVAYLRIVITDSPEWWEDGNVLDAGLLFKVYTEAQTIDPFRRVEKQKEATPDGTAGRDSNQKHLNTQPGNMLESLVDEEISTPYNEPRMEEQLPRRPGS